MAQNFTYTYLGTNALDILITFFEMVYKNIHKCKKKKIPYTNNEKRVLKYGWKTDIWKNRVPQGRIQTFNW